MKVEIKKAYMACLQILYHQNGVVRTWGQLQILTDWHFFRTFGKRLFHCKNVKTEAFKSCASTSRSCLHINYWKDKWKNGMNREKKLHLSLQSAQSLLLAFKLLSNPMSISVKITKGLLLYDTHNEKRNVDSCRHTQSSSSINVHRKYLPRPKTCAKVRLALGYRGNAVTTHRLSLLRVYSPRQRRALRTFTSNRRG